MRPASEERSGVWVGGRRAAEWLAAGLALGLLIGWRAAGTNPALAGPGDGSRAALWIALVYALLALVLGGLFELELALLRRARPPSPAHPLPFGSRAGVALLALAAYALASLAATHGSAWATEVDRRTVAVALAVALAVQLALAALLARSAASPARAVAWLGRLGLAAGALASLAVALGRSDVEQHETRGQGGAAAASAGAPTVQRLVVVGIDGADWRHLDPLLEAGRLPHLERLVAAGARAPLSTLTPTWSPCIWTTIATGRPPEEHGVLDFVETPVPGFARGLQRLRVVERLAQGEGVAAAPMPPHVGLTPLIYGLVSAGVLVEQPVRANQRRVKALWNVLSDQGREIAVVRWWASWPAEEVRGVLVADAAVRGQARELALARAAGEERAPDPTLAFPPELLVELAASAQDELADPARWWDETDPQGEAWRVVETLPLFADLDADQRRALAADAGLARLALNTLEQDRFSVRATRAALERGAPELALVYLQGVDALAHRLERHALRDPGMLRVIERYWEELDLLLGELARSAGDEATWLVVSDHGWSYAPERYGHYHAPEGVFLLSGPGARAGAHPGEVGVADVFPTALALLGLPPSRELAGRAVLEALADELRAAAAARTPVESFGSHQPRWSGAQDTGDGLRADQLETLKELGYVQ